MSYLSGYITALETFIDYPEVQEHVKMFYGHEEGSRSSDQ